MSYLTALTTWYTSEQGQQVYEHEAMQLAQILPNCFGYHLLQFGGPTNLQWLNSSPIKHHMVLLSDYDSTNQPTCLAEPDKLPFPPNSVDVVFLPHTLETIAKPEVLLREISDILIPGGYIIILGVNQVSLWGIQQHLKQPNCFPWLQHFHTIHSIQKKLMQFNCIVDSLQFEGYQPLPTNKVKPLFYHHSFWDTFGAFMWPSWGNIYIMLARKHVYGITPIMPKPLFKELKPQLTYQQLRKYDVKKS